MDLFNFDPTTVFSFLLTLFRVSLVLFTLPFFGGQFVPPTVKAALCLVLALALWPQLSFPGASFPSNLWTIALMLLGELTLGLILSLVVQFLFAAVQTGGAIMGFQMGFSMVSIVDPMTGGSETATSYFLYMITLLTFLALNGHLVLLSGLAQTFEIIPPGGLYITPALASRLLGFSTQIFLLAIKIAAPVLVAVLMIDLTLALVSRVAPQMNVLTLGFPVKIGVGFLFLGLVFTYLARYVGDFIANLGPAYTALLGLASRP
jgi:flagellar biosynthetic protein FliR